MKETTLAKILAVACGLATVTAVAQTSTTVTTTKDAAAGEAVTQTTTSTVDTAGTITEYRPGGDYFMLRAGTTGAPARFYYNNDTHVFDPEGHPVSWSVVRPDIPAKVYYVREGDRMIVRKVVLSKPVVVEKETTTTVTTERR